MNVYHITYTPTTQTACVYFLGCNFLCKGCIRKNSNLDVHIKQNIIKKNIRILELNEVIGSLSKQPIKKVIFLGGEPTTDPELGKLVNILFYQYGTYNVLFTNGYNLSKLDGIAEICISIKAVSPKLHEDFTGYSNQQVLENFKHLAKNNCLILRSESIFIPDYIDCSEIERIAEFIAGCNPEIHYRIDGYIPINNTLWRIPTEKELIVAVEIARKKLQNVTYLCQGTKLKYEVIEII